MRRAPNVRQLLREIGGRVRDARTAAGLTQEDAAHEAGIDYKRWQRLESGTVNATVQTLARVAAALGTTYWELCSRPRR